MDIASYLDKAKDVTGSDYKTAKALGITRQHISMIRTRGSMSDDIALLLAELLEINPLEVIAAANAEKTKDPIIKKKWEEWGKAVSNYAATVFFGALLVSTVFNYSAVLYIM